MTFVNYPRILVVHIHQGHTHLLTLFSLIHGDIWRPSKIPNVTGARWFLLLVDDHMQLSWVFLMKQRSKANQIFQTFHTMIQNQFQVNIKILRTDNARVFFNLSFTPYLQSHGIIHQSSLTERKNRHLLEVA